MKRITAVIVSLMLTAPFLAFAQQAQEPQQGGEIRVAITAPPPGWDPTVSTSQEIPRVVYNNLFEGLVKFDRTGAIVPALAESWDISADTLTWTFKVREGVKFHDGSALQLSDIVAKFERARDPESGHTHSEYYSAITSVTADEAAATVTFVLSEPRSGLLFDLARADSVIYPAAKAETQRSEPIGTGPFRFVNYLEGSEVRLERFEDYWQAGVPYLDAVTFVIMSDPNSRFAALQSGDIDLIGVALAPEQFIQLQGNPELQGTQGTATAEITLAMNNAREPFDNLLVRQAITHAIDKDALVNGAFFGLGTPIGSHMSPSEPYYIDLTGTYPHDPQRARELLAEAGYPDGFTVKLELPEPYNLERRSGEVVAQQLAQVGITAEVSIVEWATWLSRIFTGGDYDMTIIGHSEPRDINVYGNPGYYYHYDNPAVAALLDDIQAAPGDAAANALYQEIARIIAEDAVNVWLFSSPYLVAARADLHGFWTDQPTPAIDVTQVYRAR
jgi:peptide/nickel transport system substrate-binding protein